MDPLTRFGPRFASIVIAICACSCAPPEYVPELAARPYPFENHTTNAIDVQCFRRGTELEIVNATAHSYADFDLWINQRFVHRVTSMGAGETIRVSLWEFFDEFGKRFNAGGFFRAYPAQPVRLVQIQTAEDQPMIALVAIRSEDIIKIERQR